MHLTGILALVMCGPALILSILSVALPHWSSLEDDDGNRIDIGLWHFCMEGPRLVDFCAEWIYNTRYKQSSEIIIFGEKFSMRTFKGVQAMECLGLLCAVGGLSCILMFECIPRIHRKRAIGMFGILFSLFAGIFTILGTILYGAVITQYLDASFIFALCAGIVYIIASILFICDCKVKDAGESDSCVSTEVKSDFDAPVFQVIFHSSPDKRLRAEEK